MTELELTVEALKRCVPKETFEKAMEEVRRDAPPEKEADREGVIERVLLEMGIPHNLRGFRYAATAVGLIIDRPGALLCKEIYPEVARLHDTTPRKSGTVHQSQYRRCL